MHQRYIAGTAGIHRIIQRNSYCGHIGGSSRKAAVQDGSSSVCPCGYRAVDPSASPCPYRGTEVHSVGAYTQYV